MNENILNNIREEIMDTGAYEQEVHGKTEFLRGINYCLGVIDKYYKTEKAAGVTGLKLHPCYCGGEMKIQKVSQNGGMDGSYYNWKLTCKKCGLTMAYPADGFYGRKYKTLEEVADDWNQKFSDEVKE